MIDTSISDACTYQASNADAATTRQNALYEAHSQYTAPTFAELNAGSASDNPVRCYRSTFVLVAFAAIPFFILCGPRIWGTVCVVFSHIFPNGFNIL